MGFRDLFKVRKPGNGDAFQKSVLEAGKKKLDAGDLKANDYISKDKKSV